MANPREDSGLTEAMGEQLLRRASELDVAERTSATPTPGTPARSRVWNMVGPALVVAAFGAIGFFRMTTPRPALPMVEQSFVLNCISPTHATALLRAAFSGQSHSISFNDQRAPRVLTVRASEDRMRDVRALLEKNDRVGSSSCPAR